MKVKLLFHTPLKIASIAIRRCWDSADKSDTEDARCAYIEESIMDGGDASYSQHIIGDKDKALIDRVGNKNKHSSTLEHLNYNFEIKDVSRALLQEFARHRIASLSVKSSRYTLKELKEEQDFRKVPFNSDLWKKYLVYTTDDSVNVAAQGALVNLQRALKEGVSNDIAKYCMPESYKTELSWTINARSLQNFLFLRSDKAALWEIRELANKVFEALPDDHKYLFEHCMK